MVITMEELAELQKEVSKAIRGKDNKTELLEEMADVYLGLYWLMNIFDIKEKDMNKAINVKLERQKERNNTIKIITNDKYIGGKRIMKTNKNEFIQDTFLKEQSKKLWNDVCKIMEELKIPYVSLKKREISNILPEPIYDWTGEYTKSDEDYFYFNVTQPTYSRHPDVPERYGLITCVLDKAQFHEKYSSIEEFNNVIKQYEKFLQKTITVLMKR